MVCVGKLTEAGEFWERVGAGVNSTHTVDYKLQLMGNLFKKPSEKIESTNPTCPTPLLILVGIN